MAARVVLRAAGSSSSVSSGTLVAELAAATGKKLVEWSLYAGHGTSAGTQERIIVTFSDNSTVTQDSVSGTGLSHLANVAAIFRRGPGLRTTVGTTLPVIKLRVETQDVGAGPRYAVISAVEVSQ